MNTPADDDEFGDGGAPPICTDDFDPIPLQPLEPVPCWCVNCGLRQSASGICPNCGSQLTRLGAA